MAQRVTGLQTLIGLYAQGYSRGSGISFIYFSRYILGDKGKLHTHIMSPTNVCTNVNISVYWTMILKVLIVGVSRASKTFKGRVKLKTLMDLVTRGLLNCRTKGIRGMFSVDNCLPPPPPP